MRENFIAKLKTDKYLIGSFDAYLDLSKQLIIENLKLDDEEVDTLLKGMATNYRASIVDSSGEYIGFIGLYDIDAKNEAAAVRFLVNRDISLEDRTEIKNEYLKYISESINIHNIKEDLFVSKNNSEIKKKEFITSNIIVPNKLLISGVDQKAIELFGESIAKLQMPFTIKVQDRVIGVIGLSNLIWSNKRANLNIYIDERLGTDIISDLSSYLIDEYLSYVHSANVHSVSLAVNGSNNNLLEVLKNTNMNYYGNIPYGVSNGINVESNMLFQHIPGMKKEKGLYIPDNQFIKLNELENNQELRGVVELENGYRLVSPKKFESLQINKEEILKEHINAMQEREKFTMPLGEDKYFLQIGNGMYGLSKAFNNYTYLVLDDENSYAGYVNILRNNANNKNCEIEIGIDPKVQKKGLGTMVINSFYDELFKSGYLSVTSSVFEFNNPSIRLHEKVANLNGIRLDSYYINGKLYDMSIYSKVSEKARK